MHTKVTNSLSQRVKPPRIRGVGSSGSQALCHPWTLGCCLGPLLGWVSGTCSAQTPSCRKLSALVRSVAGPSDTDAHLSVSQTCSSVIHSHLISYPSGWSAGAWDHSPAFFFFQLPFVMSPDHRCHESQLFRPTFQSSMMRSPCLTCNKSTDCVIFYTKSLYSFKSLRISLWGRGHYCATWWWGVCQNVDAFVLQGTSLGSGRAGIWTQGHGLSNRWLL